MIVRHNPHNICSISFFFLSPFSFLPFFPQGMSAKTATAAARVGSAGGEAALTPQQYMHQQMVAHQREQNRLLAQQRRRRIQKGAMPTVRDIMAGKRRVESRFVSIAHATLFIVR